MKKIDIFLNVNCNVKQVALKKKLCIQRVSKSDNNWLGNNFMWIQNIIQYPYIYDKIQLYANFVIRIPVIYILIRDSLKLLFGILLKYIQ